ncbi:uncharacterized protein LOC133291303 [Gastrolobium bilobum]|uniref:uncharacterized protein LOC133291303 n=1 Tax=Gastrolobium bilobum TaxID=150636 RepID=UPI002AB2028D|nr:uncharacterized protein LOC133291303 [Gastrolobium bilobum]XP_061345529.1 uncharacterized protein LOC133291303 [Gastrolobium bilobum]
MNQQNQGSGSQSNVPMKRKRGRPRKEESMVQVENAPAMPGSDNVLNSNQTAGTTDDCVDEMVGKVVTGVVEGTFKAGYLLKVKLADTDAILRGVVFLPGQVAPITAENDVAPHITMTKRKDVPIPVLNPQTETHDSVPSSVQCSKPSFEPELQVPMSEDQVLPTEIHSGISVSLENQPASTLIPVADFPKNETSISSGGIPQGTSDPVHVILSASIISELECDKTVKQGETLNELDASAQVKESSADGGTTKDSKPINIVPTIENSDKELRTGQQQAVHQLNEVIHDEANRSNIELNQIPVSAEPESMPSEQTSKSVDYFVEKQASPKTDVLEDTKTKLAPETSNLNGRPSTGVANILDAGSNHAHETSQPESLPSQQIGESVPADSKSLPEGCDFQQKSDPQIDESVPSESKFSSEACDFQQKSDLHSDFNQPPESLVKSVESEIQTGSS